MFGGYRPYEVDSFIDNIQISFSEIQRENIELKGYIKELTEKLDKYKEEESCIRNAILSAQKLADASLLDADNKSKSMILDASKQANEIIYKAKREAERERGISWRIHMEAERFRSKLIKLYDDQVDLVKRSLDGVNEDEVEPDQIKVDKLDEDRHEDTNEGFVQSDYLKQEDKILEDALKQEDQDMIEISSNDNIDSGLDEDDSEVTEESEKEINQVRESRKKKLENLKFGSNYHFSSQEFGEGLYSGLFRRKK